ncbi:HNH endonuclease [Rugamonas rubra]|uniref:HNH endonuclease n=1 Tax=Rugamonas rubra TaxID=758825 RepID=A0A1I4NC95_9BURK|nr:HNH endonuclease [Rugamonas rubra]SFM13144.1 HNH endonuclease [Rugamonas rubra]
MEELDHAGRQLLTVLVQHISSGNVRPSRPETFITYQDTHRRLGLTCDASGSHDYGRCLKQHGLDSLGRWLKDTGKPAIVGLIVKKHGAREPGDGFFDLFEPQGNPYEWWENEISRSIEPFEQWSPYVASTASPRLPASVEKVVPAMPRTVNTIYELLVDVGINVDEWDVSVDGEPIANPRNNPSRNTAWSYGGESGEPTALCIWHDLISWDCTPPEFAYNEIEYQIEVANERTFTKDSKKKARLTKWLKHSSEFFMGVRQAYLNRSPIRIILLAGTRVGIRDSSDEQGGVTARELDPVAWYAHEWNPITGAYRLVRGLALPEQATSDDSDDNADPLNSPALFALVGTLDETEVLAIVKARTRQSQFRKSLLERWRKCSVSGCGLTEVLIASHIKPWSVCETYEERVGVANGLLLTPNLDSLFDEGLITFQDDFQIKISPLLRSGFQLDLKIDHHMRLLQRHEDIRPFLKWHRENRYYETEQQRVSRCGKLVD